MTDKRDKIKSRLARALAGVAAVVACAAGIPVYGAAASVSATQAQQEAVVPVVVEPLFEYPVAPETLSSLQDKSDWIVTHFWDGMDLGRKNAVDQNALNHAFSVFCSPMQWASGEATAKGVENLLSRLRKNPTLLLQFTKAAEENLYGQRAPFWIDDVYMRFLDEFLKCKKIDKVRKLRYADQQRQLKASAVGGRAAEFDFTDPEGASKRYFPMSTVTVIEFGDPDCHECRMGKIKLDTDIRFSRLVNAGKVNVLFIMDDPEEGWQEKVADYPKKWAVGASSGASDIYDIRVSPCFYVVDSEGKIAAKNIGVDEAMAKVFSLVGE